MFFFPSLLSPASSESLELYPSSQTTERHQSHLLSPSPTDISSYMPTQMVSTAQWNVPANVAQISSRLEVGLWSLRVSRTDVNHSHTFPDKQASVAIVMMSEKLTLTPYNCNCNTCRIREDSVEYELKINTKMCCFFFLLKQCFVKFRNCKFRWNLIT